MARTQFKVTFTNAQPGAPVEILSPSTEHVYPSSAASQPVGGKQLYLDATNSITVWSDAQDVIAQTVDGAGLFIQGTATVASSTVTVADGTAPTNPAGSAASSVTFNANTHAIGTAASTSTSGSPANNNDGPVVALAVGPVKVAPGGYVVTFTYTTQGAARLVNLNAQVANADVTEAIYFFAGDLPVDLGPSGQITGAQLDFAPTLVGTDLSVDVDGTVRSAAGGVFWIAANFYVRPA